MASPDSLIFVIVVVLATSVISTTSWKLSPSHYQSTCPKALEIVRAGVAKAIKKETRLGASLLRLHFHDCFVNGCDASILLDDTSNFVGEKTAGPNNNSVRGFEVIDAIKARLEKACPGVVSCADIVALAARDSVVHLGGPSWNVSLGRRDATTASRSLANTLIPSPASNLSTLITSFAAQGLSVKNMVALSGSHTIGLARCTSFRGRIYNDTNINKAFAQQLQKKCPKVGNDGVLQRLDIQSPTLFDNFYFKNLLHKKGLLHSDQELFNGNSVDSLAKKYAYDSKEFFNDFAKAMIKMSKIKTLTGTKGQIRKNCRKVN